MFTSIIIGLASTLLLFLLSTVVVVGVKVCLISVRKVTSKSKPTPTPTQAETVKKRRSKPVKTIEIDTELADRIYFKKSS